MPVKSTMILYDSGPGPIRSVIEASGPALALFGKSEANDIIRAALQAGGDIWIEVFLPKRFSEYARTLGYHIQQKYDVWKTKHLGASVPLVGVGGTAGASDSTLKASEKAHATATAKGRSGVISIRIPTGHALQAKEQAVLRTVPRHEIDRIAREVEKTLIDLLNGYTVNTLRSGRMVATLGGRPPADKGAARPRGPAKTGTRKAA